MYAGAVAVPLIVGAAFKVSAADMAVLIAADIFTAGIATALTCIGVWKIGARLPIMQGCTFAAVGPIVAAAGQGHELTDVFGAIIIAGLIAVLLPETRDRIVATVISAEWTYAPDVLDYQTAWYDGTRRDPSRPSPTTTANRCRKQRTSTSCARR